MDIADTSFPGFLSALDGRWAPHDHRRRRTRRERQGHDRPGARRAISACRTWTPACSTAPPPSTCWRWAAIRRASSRRARACDLSQIDFADPELKSETVGGIASRISTYPLVRDALLERQRRFAGAERRRRPRRPRHRHGDRARGRGQALRHRPPRNPRPPPLRRIEGAPASTSIIADVLADIRARDERDTAATRRRWSWPPTRCCSTPATWASRRRSPPRSPRSRRAAASAGPGTVTRRTGDGCSSLSPAQRRSRRQSAIWAWVTSLG